nr:hypothetical protein [bacterium]
MQASLQGDKGAVDLEEEKQRYLAFFPERFLSLLEQLQERKFKQGGTIPVDTILKQITYVIQRAEDETDPEVAFTMLMRLMERANFCKQAIIDVCQDAVHAIDRFPSPDNFHSLKHHLYQLLKNHRKAQLTRVVHQLILLKYTLYGGRNGSVASSFAVDTHLVRVELENFNVEEHITDSTGEDNILLYFLSKWITGAKNEL